MSHERMFAGRRSDYEIVPLGVDCKISHLLRERGLRLTAFPFDWNVAPVASAIELLSNDFADFLNPDNLVFLPPVDRLLFAENGAEIQMKNDVITPVVCKRYRMLFPHDFSKAGREDLPAVQNKYARRVERLMELLHSTVRLVFIAHDRELNSWQMQQYGAALGSTFENPREDWEAALAAVLDRRFPALNYDICDLSAIERAVGAAS